jgi:lipoprotein-releasing system permease protein
MSVSFDPMIYVIGFLMSVIVSIFASALPARLAGRMSPIDIIRSES